MGAIPGRNNANNLNNSLVKYTIPSIILSKSLANFLCWLQPKSGNLVGLLAYQMPESDARNYIEVSANEQKVLRFRGWEAVAMRACSGVIKLSKCQIIISF